MFLKPKPLDKQAEEKRAKVEMKRYDLANSQLDRQIVQERRQKNMELRRLTA